MNRTSRGIGLAIVAALALPATAGALDVIEDWRKVGPPDDNDPPHAKGELSPAAATKLVAAIDRAWKGSRVLRARGNSCGPVENLLFAFLGQDGRSRPTDMGPTELDADSMELLRRIEVLGVRPFGPRQLLLATANAFFNPLGYGYEPVTLGIVVDADGEVLDIAVLAWSLGDGDWAAILSMRPIADGVQLTDANYAPGALCGEQATVDTCEVEEGQTYALVVGRDGRFAEKGRRATTPSGQFRDGATGEELKVEAGGQRPLRVGYRARRGAPWKAMKVLSDDRKTGIVRASFPKSPATYTLTIAPDGRSLVSAGSDGSKPQRFDWVAPLDR